MSKQWIVFLALIAVAAGSVVAQDEVEVGPREQAPVIDPGERPVPVEAPTDGRQVAVVQIQFEIGQGQINSARVVETMVEVGDFAAPGLEASLVIGVEHPVASKLFGGDWEVRINGDERQAFYVFSPAYLEAETEPNSTNPFTWVAEDGLVDWTLVVPLYRNANRIDARSIVIIDRASGEIILEAGI